MSEVHIIIADNSAREGPVRLEGLLRQVEPSHIVLDENRETALAKSRKHREGLKAIPYAIWVPINYCNQSPWVKLDFMDANKYDYADRAIRQKIGLLVPATGRDVERSVAFILGKMSLMDAYDRISESLKSFNQNYNQSQAIEYHTII